jgi:hypothetical protein
LTALAATRHDVDHIEYIQFDESIVSRLGIRLVKTQGETPDAYANRSWHYDLVELSGAKLLDLATRVLRNSTTGRVLSKNVLELIKKAVTNAEIDTFKLSPKLAAKVPAVPVPTARRFVRMCRRVASEIKNAWDEFRRG